jgi:hypothetical protein
MDQLEAQHREERRRLEEAALRSARDTELHEKELLEGSAHRSSSMIAIGLVGVDLFL